MARVLSQMNASYTYQIEYRVNEPSGGGKIHVFIWDVNTNSKMAEFHTELDFMSEFVENFESPDAIVWGNMPNTQEGYFGYSVNKHTNMVTFVCNFGGFTLEIMVIINEEFERFISQLKEHKKILEQKIQEIDLLDDLDDLVIVLDSWELE